MVVHGRTKEDGYKAERINWQAIGEIRKRLSIPVIANGEIWDYESAQACMAATGCDSVMIGRGALNVPNLSRVIKYNAPRMPWAEVVTLLQNTVVWKSRVIPGCIMWRALNSGSVICAKSMTRRCRYFRRSARCKPQQRLRASSRQNNTRSCRLRAFRCLFRSVLKGLWYANRLRAVQWPRAISITFLFVAD